MAVLGYIFLVLLGLGVVAALVMLVMSIPDIRRYIRIARM